MWFQKSGGALNLDAVSPLTCLCDSVLSSHILFLDFETIIRKPIILFLSFPGYVAGQSGLLLTVLPSLLSSGILSVSRTPGLHTPFSVLFWV